MKIGIVGAGYVGLSLTTLLSDKNKVTIIDVVQNKVDQINNHISPIEENDIQKVLETSDNIIASTNIETLIDSDFIIIATPTNYDCYNKKFDTKTVDNTIETLSKISPDSTIVIKSTVPIGYTKSKYNAGFNNIIFSPEFLREGHALYDNLYPSRIIVGIPSDLMRIKSEQFANLLLNSSKKEAPILIMNADEAESVKLFSNTYLAMRISFFNELDSFAEINNLNSENIIKGVSFDPRIGNYYNNPSFGYGGYCLPKDTKQLLSNYSNVPNNLIKAIVDSNDTRKKMIIQNISLKIKKHGTVGVYNLAMKKSSDNCRESSVLDIANGLHDIGYNIIIFDKHKNYTHKYQKINDIDEFVSKSDIIVANRPDDVILKKGSGKLYSRDIFFRD